MVTKEQRIERLEKGLCSKCGIRPLVENKTLCQQCTDNKREESRRIRARKLTEGICKTCSKPKLPDSPYCEECKIKNAKYQHGKRYNKKANGICVNCTNPAVKANIYCADCLEKRRQKKALRNNQLIPKNPTVVFDKVYDVERTVWKNLQDMQFGDITVIDYSHYAEESRVHFWVCLCKCGGLRIAGQNHLVGNKILSCGCQNNKLQVKVYDKMYMKYRYFAHDYVGEILGNFMIIDFHHAVPKKRMNFWEGKCLNCGEEKLILIENKIPLCKCDESYHTQNLSKLLYDLLIKVRNKVNLELKGATVLDQRTGEYITIKEDLTGKKSGQLTVIEYSYKSKKGNYWLCECKCGNMIIATHSEIINNNKTHCGCKEK